MTRVAAVDLGTNATRLLVADVVDGRVDEIVVFDKRFFPLFGLPDVYPG